MSPGLEHNALIYDSEDHLISAFRETATTAVGRDEPVLVSLDQPKSEKLAESLGQISRTVTFIEAGRRYSKPTTAMSSLADFVRSAVDSGRNRVLALGEIALATRQSDQIAWLRYEAAVNEILAHLPLRAICAYDRRLGANILEAAHQVHPQIEVAGRPSASSTYIDPARFVAQLPPRQLAPGREADLPLVRVTKAQPVRDALTELAHRRRRGEISLVVTEILSWFLSGPDNAAAVEAWREDESVVVTVTGRHAPAPFDPFPDLRTPLCIGESGLRISGELADRFAINHAPDDAVVITVAFDDSSWWANRLQGGHDR